MNCSTASCGREAKYRTLSVGQDPVILTCLRCMELYLDSGIPAELFVSTPTRKTA